MWLETAAPAARRMASNPMFLGLVANHVRNEHEFPDSPHSIFDSYIERRLKSDQDRIRRRYGLSSDDLRVTAEHIAFAMAADEGVGLNPSRDRLREAMSRVGLHTGVDITVAMDALEYIKLARSESGEPGDPASFTFAHRRFQEYFSTCVLLREPGRVGPRQLLTDARWREALVVMCQTQDPAVLAPVVAEVDRLLDEKVGWLATQKELTAADELADFPWPVGTIHLSSIIQDGFGSRLSELPHHIREKIGFILKSAFTSGSRLDRKWALDVAGPAPSETLHAMVRAAFASDSQWLRNSAYHQVARLDAISSDIAKSIREALVAMGRNGTLRVDRIATSAHLARLDRSSEFLSTLRKLVWISPISAAMHLVAVVSVLTLFPGIGTSCRVGVRVACQRVDNMVTLVVPVQNASDFCSDDGVDRAGRISRANRPSTCSRRTYPAGGQLLYLCLRMVMGPPGYSLREHRGMFKPDRLAARAVHKNLGSENSPKGMVAKASRKIAERSCQPIRRCRISGRHVGG